MEVARSLGVAPRRLWGWEPREVHDHQLDDQGRVTRTVVTREAEWDEESYGLVAALADVEASSCTGCGNDVAECMSPDGDRDNRAGTHWYSSGPPHRCHACTAREAAADAYEHGGDNPISPALRFPLRRIER